MFLDLDKALATRIQRQQILYRSGIEPRFLMWEGALLARIADDRAMHGQLLWLKHITEIPSVSLGVIPFSVTLPKQPSHSFVIYDHRSVEVELHTDVVVLDSSEDISYYTDLFEAYSEVAAFDADALGLLDSAISRVAGASL
jgi:hypothetical protein